MNICIPVKTKDGLLSKIFEHFGSAPYFVVYNTEKEDIDFLENNNEHHTHGTCQPLKALASQNIEAVVCIGMGKRAVQRLNEGGMKAYRTSAETVEEIIRKYKENTLEEITVNNACSHHNCH